jgi:hypothetical protein
VSSNINDPEIEGESSDDEPTVEKEGVMTPDQESVEDANAAGVNPEQ